MTMRKAEPKDAERIAEVHRLGRRAAMPWLPQLHTPAEDHWFFKNLVIPDQDVDVIDVDGTIAGFIACGEGWLHHLYVDPAYWHRKIGSKLLTHAQAHNKVLQAWVFQRNAAARAFYKTHGFSELELTDGDANEEKMPDVRIIWQRTDNDTK